MSAHKVIADAIDAAQGAYGEALAYEVLESLKAEGFAVVELPEPLSDIGRMFSEGSTAGTVEVDRDSGIIHHGGWEWTPEQAYLVGVQWLAAAAAAERDSEER